MPMNDKLENLKLLWKLQQRLMREKLAKLAGQEPVILSEGNIIVLPKVRRK